MREIEFNHGWICTRQGSDQQGIAVTLPHDAMITEKRSGKSMGGKNIGWFEAGDYSYTKKFTLPAQDAGKKIFFEIEGAYHLAKIYVNGTQIGYRPYGYSDFYLDATEQIRFGEENEIEIRTENADQPNSRWYSGTGLYRPVHLYVADQEHILLNGIQVETLKTDPAEIQVTVRTGGTGTVNVQILDGDRIVLQAQTETTPAAGIPETDNGLGSCRDGSETQGIAVLKMAVPGAKLWSMDTPHLYRCRVTFMSDLQDVSFGIRSLTWDRQSGIAINGKRVILRGACIHHDNGVLGACAFPEAEERKIRLLKENGYNAVRSAHNPCSKALLDACDRLGMLMMDEYVDVWYIHKTEHDYADFVDQWWKTDLRELVQKDYNHPCVILYSTGNEVAETGQKRGIALTKEMTAYLHELDASRPVSCGINIFFNFLSSIGFGVYSDDKAKKDAEKSARSAGKEKKKKPVGSEFYNTLAGMFGDYTMKLGATLHGCDVRTRDAYAGMDIAGYNYGIFRYLHDLRKYPDRLILGSETFCKDAYLFWEKARNHPGIVGDFVWAGVDYIGEAGIGSWEYEDYAPADADEAGWLTGGSGRIDIVGNTNGEALYTKVAFEQTQDIYLAVKPVYQKGKHSPSAWKMTEAEASWSYPGCEGTQAVIEVYARAAEVEVFLNDRSIGRKRMKNTCRAIFHAAYEPGVLRAVAYNQDGKKIRETSLSSAGDETCLMLTPESSGTVKEGLTYIQVKYTDANGIWKPMEKHHIQVTVQNGILKGLGNACPYNPDGYDKDNTGTYYGRALAVVQADGTGPVTVTVRDEARQETVQIPLAE